MQAVEFEADIQNGMIPLPGKLRLLQTGHLRIIALFQDTIDEDQPDLAEALRFPDTAGSFTLNWDTNKDTREQMNER